MSETVTVTGTPTLTIVVGEKGKTQTEKTAKYASGSGTNALVFEYTVARGDADDNGVSVKADTLALNGGTIKDTVGNPATLTHTAVADSGPGHKVDTALLQVNTVTFTSTGPLQNRGSH